MERRPIKQPYLYRFVRVIRDDRDKRDKCPEGVRSIDLATLKEWCGVAAGEEIPEELFTEYLMPPSEVPWEQPEPHSVLFVTPREPIKDVRLHLYFVVHDVELQEDGGFVDPLTMPVSSWIPGSFLHEHMKKAFKAAGISLRHLQPPDAPGLRQRIAQAKKRLQDKRKGFGAPRRPKVRPWAVKKASGRR